MNQSYNLKKNVRLNQIHGGYRHMGGGAIKTSEPNILVLMNTVK